MKKYIFFFAVICIIPTVVNAQSLTNKISWPVNYTVFQRNTTTTGGSATVSFNGQVSNGQVNNGNNNSQYRVEKLNKNGGTISDYISWQAIPGLSNIGNTGSLLFNFELYNIPTGWYRFSIKNNYGTTVSVKFGVGEVFVIAGQSNAAGSGNVMNVQSNLLNNYDCVVSFKPTHSSADFDRILNPVFGPLNSSNPDIGPEGKRPWFYQYIGEKIVDREGGGNSIVPVCFFNTALEGSGIDMWKRSMDKTRLMFNNNYYNDLIPGTTFTHKNAFGFTNNDTRYPYINLKKVLSYYCNVVGVRAIIWHQGESETKFLLTQKTENQYNFSDYLDGDFNITTYDTKLKAIIEDTRRLIPNLTWGVSRASLFAAIQNSTGNTHYDITNDSKGGTGSQLKIPDGMPNSYSTLSDVISEQNSVTSAGNVILLTDTDQFDVVNPSNISYRSDGTHFNEKGLEFFANDLYNNYMGTLIGKTPYLAKHSMKMLYAGRSNGNDLTNVMMSTDANKIIFYSTWSDNAVYAQSNAMSTNFSSSTNKTFLKAFGKDVNGRIYHTVTANFNNLSNFRIATTNQLQDSNIYPNPVSVNESLHVYFELAEDAEVSISLMDERENLIASLPPTNYLKGKNDVLLQSNQMTISQEPGKVFFCKIRVNGQENTTRIVFK